MIEALKERLTLRLLGPALLGFWALYFAIVALSNLTDLLVGVGILPAGWRWVSGNLAFVAASTARVGAPAWVNPILLAGVVGWQGLIALLFWRAAREPRGPWLGPAFVAMITGSVVVDQIFSTGGIGTYFVNSALNRDYSVLMGVTILVGALTIAFNLVVDILYAWIDPKIRY